MTLGLVEKLKNSDFILESKMAELNQKKYSKQPDWPDAARKLFFYLGNKWIAYLTQLFIRVQQNRFSKSVRTFPRKLSI